MTTIHHLMFFGSMMLPEECQKAPGCPFSANRFQFELLSRLHESYSGSTTAICLVPTPSFPRGRPLLFGRRQRQAKDGFRLVSPPFLNLGILKVFSLLISVFFVALSEALRRGKPQTLLLYNAYLGYSLPALLLGRLWHVPVVGIVADLPPSAISRLVNVRGIEARLQHWATKKLSALMPFSIHVAQDLHFKGPVMRIDPGIEAEDFANLAPNKRIDGSRVVFFAGALNEANGLPFLLEAFGQVTNPAVELWISGRGELQATIEEKAKRDSRVRYLGFLERNELLALMRSSRLLINPRPSSLPEHRYNFPSKILEYLAVGRPVLSTSTSDVAAEYGDYLFLLESETATSLAQLIESTWQKDDVELQLRGERGRQYVLNNKNWEVLSKKVASFLSSLERNTADA